MILTKPQDTVQDWLELHELTSEEVIKCCSIIGQKFQTNGTKSSRYQSKSLSFDLKQSFELLVLPALRELLGIANLYNLSRIKIVRYKTGELDLPFTEWNDRANTPIVHLVWSGTAADLICLAHETAHALQMILSNGAFMPPVVRETCAFLGELALIQHAKTKSGTLYRELQDVWHHENYRYLGADVVQLADDLKAGQSPYRYRHNYPLARITAISVFAAYGSNLIKEVFSNVTGAIEFLKPQEVIQDLQKSDIIHTRNLNQSAADEDIVAFRMSLSPRALNAVRTGKISYEWLYRSASARCIVGNRVEGITHLPTQLWIKWRSLGVFALVALNCSEANILPEAFLKKYESLAEQSSGLAFSAVMPWVRPLKFDALTSLGLIIQQLSKSPYHQQFKLSYYLPVEVIPPLTAQQAVCFIENRSFPLGLVTWAWLSEQTKNKVHKTGCALRLENWSEGKNLFFNDWITDKRCFRAAMKFMTHDMFPDQTASSLRRNTDGSVRKINRWVGGLNSVGKSMNNRS